MTSVATAQEVKAPKPATRASITRWERRDESLISSLFSTIGMDVTSSRVVRVARWCGNGAVAAGEVVVGRVMVVIASVLR